MKNFHISSAVTLAILFAACGQTQIQDETKVSSKAGAKSDQTATRDSGDAVRSDEYGEFNMVMPDVMPIVEGDSVRPVPENLKYAIVVKGESGFKREINGDFKPGLNVKIDALPAGNVEVKLEIRDDKGVVFKSGSGKGNVVPRQVSKVLLEIGRPDAGKPDTGGIDVLIVERPNPNPIPNPIPKQPLPSVGGREGPYENIPVLIPPKPGQVIPSPTAVQISCEKELSAMCVANVERAVCKGSFAMGDLKSGAIDISSSFGLAASGTNRCAARMDLVKQACSRSKQVILLSERCELEEPAHIEIK